MKEYRERELKWLSVVSKMDVGTVEKDSKLKKLVRSGIPASIRAKSWQFLSRSREYQKPGLYKVDQASSMYISWASAYTILPHYIDRPYYKARKALSMMSSNKMLQGMIW